MAQRRCLCTSTVDVPIPELGAESNVEGGILSISKGEGDFVAAEEMVAEIETGARLVVAPTSCRGARAFTPRFVFFAQTR